jgi:hypothetical protein
VHSGDRSGRKDSPRLLEGLLVLGREPDDDISRQVEIGEGFEAPEVGRGRVPASHDAQHAIIARLQRHVQVPGDGRSLPQRAHELIVHVVDLDRRQAQTLEPGRRTGLANEPRERVPMLPVSEAAEVDPCEDDFAVPLLDALANLPQDRVGCTAPRSAAHERDHAELAREAAPVLDADERAHAVEPRVGPDASNRTDVPGHERGRLLGPPRDDGHVPG